MKSFCFDDADEGKAEVAVGGTTVLVDVWQAQKHIHHIAAEYAAKPDHEFWPAIIDYFASLGFPRMSFLVAYKVWTAIHTTAGELEKKVESATGSPAGSRDGTDSTVSTGPSQS